MPPTPRKRSPSRSQIEKRLWDIVSLYIRTRDKRRFGPMCFFCKTNPIQCAMHIIPRGKRGTKYDERNILGGCHSCNFKDGPGYQHDRFVADFQRHFGSELYLELEAKSREITRQSKADLLELEAEFKKKLESVCKEG